MSAAQPNLLGPAGGPHPAVVARRRRQRVQIAVACLIPLVLALAISVAVPNPSLTLLIAGVVGVAAVVALAANPHLEVSVVILALYLGMLEGPVKLGSGGHAAAAVVRDVLIFAVVLGALLRLVAREQPVKLPKLSGWVFAWAAIVLVEIFNPKTLNIEKVAGGLRQQMEWLPFFFFGYALIRSKERFRKLFLLIGVIALANGVVNVYQTRLSPTGLASWGPGYKELVFGTVEAGGSPGTTGGLAGRTYAVEGVAHVRPPGLGTDSGFGGGVGVVALAGLFALLATGRLRRRWPVLVLVLGALTAIVTGLGRIQVVGGVLAIVAFAALSFTVGRQVTRPLLALALVFLIAVPLGAVLVSVEGAGTFSRYTSIAPENVASSKDKKTSDLEHIPSQLAAAPFGVGLGTVGASAGFGGKASEELEGHNVSAETEYNFVIDEVGLPGLIVWVALTITLLTLVIRRLPKVKDVELRLYLAATFAPIVAYTIMGFSGPTMSSAAYGPYFWLSVGIASYWLVGPGRYISGAEPRSEPAAATALAGV